MHKYWLIVCLFGCKFCFAQRALLFTNSTTNDSIVLSIGQKATIMYNGYQNQTELFNQIVTDITDSTIVLGMNLTNSESTKRQIGKSTQTKYKVIRIADITGFRRITLGRQLAKSAVEIGLLVGSVVLLQSVYNAPNLSATSDFLLSMGVGFTVFGVQSVILPENIKYYMADGWKATVISD